MNIVEKIKLSFLLALLVVFVIYPFYNFVQLVIYYGKRNYRILKEYKRQFESKEITREEYIYKLEEFKKRCENNE
jgi:hypothetical protein